jgi:phenylpropionate dioxygenase-like ring-hydroxylating dioxygenase large terminal subunit
MITLLESLEDEEKKRTANPWPASAFSERWVLGKGILQLFHVTLQHMESELQDLDGLFANFARSWSAYDREHLCSQYPNFTNPVKRGEVDDIELNACLANFNDLYLHREDGPEIDPLSVNEETDDGLESEESE